MDQKIAELSASLKSKCVEFTFENLLKDFVASPYAEPFIETHGGSDEEVGVRRNLKSAADKS